MRYATWRRTRRVKKRRFDRRVRDYLRQVRETADRSARMEEIPPTRLPAVRDDERWADDW